GGVVARLMWLGTGHTRGDEITFVEPDAVLLPGDIVENKMVPSMPNTDSSAKGWIEMLDRIETLKPKFIVPDHGTLGDGSLVGKERAFLMDLRSRALELKGQGKSVEEVGKQVTEELKAKYPDWENLGPVAYVVRRVYAETP